MITECRSCGSKRLKDILTLGKQYLSDFVDGDEKPPSYPLDLVICEECTLLQLKHSTPPSLLYTPRYGYRSGINDTIRSDLKEIVNKASNKVQVFEGDCVVDIGANDGTLLSNYPKELYRVAYEPIEKLALACQQHASFVINDYFNYEVFQKYNGEGKAKIITVISCFYDLEDPNKFVGDLKKLLHEDGVIVIQQNYLAGMIKQTAFDNIVHEHLEYYSLSSLEHLLNRHNLEVVDVETNSINGGSFRVYVKHMDRVKLLRKLESKMKLDTISTYFLFSLRVKNIKKQVYEFIKREVENGKKVYLYGASTRGNTLLQACKLDNKLITAAVERNPEKWGKKIASLGIPIISEEQARVEKPDYMLVLPWFFKEEFLEREKEYLAGGGHFIFPLPKFEVI